MIRDDVMALMRDHGERGLLDGVVVPQVEINTSHRGARGRRRSKTSLTDLDGAPTAVSSLFGRQVLLVNWSPHCGFCSKIAGELGELRPALDDHGVTLAFVTSGDAESNRALFDEAALSSVPVLPKDPVDPFAGFGTPAAHLLDGDGRVAAPMAYGANEVPVLARELAGVTDEPTEVDTPGEDPTPSMSTRPMRPG